MKRNLRTTLTVISVIVVSALFWWAVSLLVNSQQTADPGETSEPTSSASAPSTAPTEDSLHVTVNSQTRSNIKKVLTVYFASPSKRTISPKDVAALTTAELNDSLTSMWRGETPGIGVSVASITVSSSGIETGNTMTVTAGVKTVVDIYGDKTEETSEAIATLVRVGSAWKVNAVEELPVADTP